MSNPRRATVQELRDRLVRTAAAIARVDSGARDADADVRRRWAESSRECARLQETARARLRELEAAEDDDWERAADGARGAWEALERAASEAAGAVLGAGALSGGRDDASLRTDARGTDSRDTDQ